MTPRKINEPLLLCRTFLYRVVAVVFQTVFIFILYGITMGQWKLELAFGGSVLLNLFNTVVYFGFHHWFDSRFKIGRN